MQPGGTWQVFVGQLMSGKWLKYRYVCMSLSKKNCHVTYLYWKHSNLVHIIFFCILIFKEREKEEGRERETLICCSTYLCIHWLLLVCALTGDQTCNLGISGGCCNPGIPKPPGGHRPVSVHDLLGTRPHSSRWAAGELAKLHLYWQPAAPQHSHYLLSSTSYQISSGIRFS